MLFLMSVECSIIAEMRPLDRDVMHYLSERTDFNTCIIGKTRKVSYGGMALDLSERDVARRVKNSLVKLTMCQIRESVNRLVNKGLFVRLSKEGKGNNLVLLRKKMVDLVAMDDSVKNPVHRVARSFSYYLKPLNLFQNNMLESKIDKEKHAVHSSVPRTSLLHTTTMNFEKKPMTLDWEFSEKDMEMILFRAFGNKYTIKDIDLVWVAEFVTHWSSEPGRLETQAKWTGKLGMSIVDYFRRPGLYDERRGISQQKASSPTAGRIEKNSSSLPDWAKQPRNDDDLVMWARGHGYGDGPIGYDYNQLRGWLRRKVDARMLESNLPKIMH